MKTQSNNGFIPEDQEPASPSRIEQLKFLMKEQNLRFKNLDDLVSGVARDLRAGRSVTPKSVGGIAEATWKLHEHPETVSEPKDAVNRFWENLCKEINDGCPLPNRPDFDTFKKLFYRWLVPLIAPSQLAATLDLLVWLPNLHDFVSVRTQGTRPLRAGDRVRVEAKITSGGKAHFYLVWLSLERGRQLHAPFHPWARRWDTFRSDKDVQGSKLLIPESPNEGLPLQELNPCLETVVLFASQKPLKPDLRSEIANEFRIAVKAVTSPVRLKDTEILYEFTHPAEPDNRALPSLVRLPGPPVRIGDPVHEFTTALRDKFAAQFDLIRTLTVAYVGESKAR